MHSISSAAIYAALRERMGESQPEPRLSATKAALRELGDPHLDFPFIHVTGTNGKTSTSRITESILRATGRKTGLFTSPHLTHFSERIAIDGTSISESQLSACWSSVAGALAQTDQDLHRSGQAPLTFFEALTVLAFSCFSSVGVDCAVIEVGMGGEWDSTNVADGSVAVITPVSLDHAAQLGSTVEGIARTKSGIIKPGARVVCAAQDPAALKEIRHTARKQKATMLVLQHDFAVTTVPVPSGQDISVSGLRHPYDSLYLPLHGDHQATNAALAIAAAEAFLPDSPPDPAAVVAGVRAARSPGRLQQILHKPVVYVDVAHNPAGAQALADALAPSSARHLLGVVLCILEDKDAHGVVAALSQVSGQYFVTASHSERALPAQDLAQTVRNVDNAAAITVCLNPQDALSVALAWAAEQSDRSLLITGSSTLVGDVLTLIGAHQRGTPARHTSAAHQRGTPVRD